MAKFKLTQHAVGSVSKIQEYYKSILDFRGPCAASYTFWVFGQMPFNLVDYALDTLYNRCSAHNHAALVDMGYAYYG